MTEKLLKEICDNLNQVKAINITTFNLSKVSAFFDHVVIASASSTAHCRGISDKLLSDLSRKPKGIEGQLDYNWLLLDYGSVIVHLFLDELRPDYNLEELYQSRIEQQQQNENGA